MATRIMPQLRKGILLRSRGNDALSAEFQRPPLLVQWDRGNPPLRRSNRGSKQESVRRCVCLARAEEKSLSLRAHARLAGKVWRDHGALEYRECIADDVPKGKITSFPRCVKLKSTESVWISCVVYRNRKHRDRVIAKVMKDPRLAKYMNAKAMSLDGRRAIMGGFKVVVNR
jgi:uncharacterized protein YbaA (DUF1428 family)